MQSSARRRAVALLMLVVPSLALPRAVRAQDAPKKPWSFTGKFTTVFTAGNSSSSTFGLGTTLAHARKDNELKFEGGGIRTESGQTTRRAVGTPTSYQLQENTVYQKTAEAYYLRARNDRHVKDGFIVFAGVDWLRNTFAGIDSRFLVAAGAGNVWVNTDRFRFKTDYGVTYTFQQDVVTNPFIKQNFPGVRASYELMRQVTASTKLESSLTADLNVNHTKDVRGDWTNAMTIAINKAFAFRPGLELLWRNDPALKEVDLFDTAGNANGKVLVPLQKTDSFFTIALVVTL